MNVNADDVLNLDEDKLWRFIDAALIACTKQTSNKKEIQLATDASDK